MTHPIDALREALQAYVRADSGDDSRVVTDFIVCTASIQFHSVESRTYYTTAASGAAHSCIGLGDILTGDLTLPQEDQ